MSNTKHRTDYFQDADQKPHVLVVDDDERLRHLLFRFLSEEGFLVSTAADAAEARASLKHFVYDLIVMDVMMPGETGVELTRAIKADKLATPVLLLTALGETDSRIAGFEAGADDYLPKPFEPRELLLRMHAILRCVAAKPSVSRSASMRFGRWIFDVVRGELVDGDDRMMLTQSEQVLLKALIQHKGETVTREELAALCGVDAAERTIDVQVTRLRKKLEDDPKMPRYVQTVRGKGYVLWVDE